MGQKEESLRGDPSADQNPVEGQLLMDAVAAHRTVLLHNHSLGLIGRVVRIREELCGYTFGYSRTPQVWCVLVEVADRTIPGLAQYLFRESCREWAGYKLVNTRDDSGLVRLGQSKQAYHPCRMVSNYIVTLA